LNTYKRAALGATAIASLSVISPAHATNGYFLNGYGAHAEGQGGIGYAVADDALNLAANPASAYFLGTRIDGGIEWFGPRRGASITGNAFGPDQDYSGNGRHNFFIPNFGYTQRIGEQFAGGVAVYGNGGLNTDYRTNPYARYGATGDAGVDLQQLIVSPTIAYALTPNHSIGLGINFAYQLFEAKGIGAFGAFSQSPENVSDQGYEGSAGAGFRIGWQGHLSRWLDAGLSWQSKTWTQRFRRYRGLFADGGAFDIPETFGGGIAVKPLSGLRIAVDVQRILYSKVPAVGNPIDSLFQGRPLGSSDGPGFGWRDINVYKVGVEYQLTPTFRVRAGYNRNTQPVAANQTFINVLAPGVVQDHYSVGASWMSSRHSEWSVYAVHAPRRNIDGVNSIPPGFPPAGLGGGNANVHLSENSVGFAYGYHFGR